MKTQQGESALYYPYAHTRDKTFLKTTLLYFPTVTRMVPDGYIPEDDPEVRPFVTTHGPSGPLLQTVPMPYHRAEHAQLRLLAKIQEHEKLFVTKYSRYGQGGEDRYWIHDAKFNTQLLSYFESRALPGVAPTRTRMASGAGSRCTRRWAKRL